MKKNKNGFTVFIVLLLVGILSSTLLMVISVFGVTFDYFAAKKEFNATEDTAFQTKNITQKIVAANNAGVLVTTSINCTGNIIINEDNSVTCPLGPADPVQNKSYSTDNNDRLCSYTSDYSYVDTALSKSCDNDDLHRRILYGIIPPHTTRTVFFLNDDANEIIINNPNNTGDNINVSLPNALFKLDYSIDAGVNESFYVLDKAKFNLGKEVVIKEKITTHADILAKDIDISLDDYALNLENTTDNIISYEIKGIKDGKDVYLLPLDDKIGEVQKLLNANVTGYGDELYYYSKLLEYDDE